ncbi:tail fiber domain-containing protein [Nocardioides ochotonae]|uniref:tail fiber domain-containing protein n=1 Tax=Nocardioides ochotonae TaxID=2685869 RepID=UPI001408D67F|nr:tail fiber domain-containing protein [Nocardioides ochotonae]
MSRPDFRPPLGWRTATVSAPYAAGDLAPRYRIDSAGNTHLRGRLNVPAGQSGGAAFTLPEMFRPKTLVRVPVATLPSGTTGRVNISPDGRVIPITKSSKVSVFFLDAVVFAAAGNAPGGGPEAPAPDDDPAAEPPDVIEDIQDVLDELEHGIEFAVTRNKTYRQPNQPTGTAGTPLVAGDLWFDTDDANRIYVYNGSGWGDATSSYLFTPDGTLSVTPGGMYAYDASGQLTFALHAGSGDVVLRGTLNAALDISGATVTGGTLQTTDQMNRGLKMSDGGFVAYDAAGQPTFVVDAATGTVALRGDLTAGSTITGATFIGGQFYGESARFTAGASFEDTVGFSDGMSVAGGIYLFGEGSLTHWGTGGIDAGTGGLTTSGGISAWNGITTQASVAASANVTAGASLFTLGAPEVSATANAFIGSGGQLCKSTSSRRRKTDIEDLDVDVDVLLDLRDRQFHSLSEVEDPNQTFVGFIAEEAHALGLTPWVGYDDRGRPDSFSYPSWVVALQKIARHQRDQIADLTNRLTALEAA